MTVNAWSSGPLKGMKHSEGYRAWCQDSSDVIDFRGTSVAVISDGHGGTRYFRSQIGSKLAVLAAQEVVTGYLLQDSFTESLRNEARAILGRMASDILDVWLSKVSQYDIENPLEEWETKYIAEMNLSEKGILKRYGATLVVSVLSDSYFFGIQIGDGDLVAILPSGELLMPIPKDPRLVDNITTSLCGNDPEKDFRFCSTFNNVPASVVISSDGLSTTFLSEESFMNYAKNASVYCATCMTDRLEGDLKRRTALNNMDDISCVIQYSPEKMVSIIEAFNEKYRPFFQHEAEVKLAKQKLTKLLPLSSMPGYWPRKVRKIKKRL